MTLSLKTIGPLAQFAILFPAASAMTQDATDPIQIIKETTNTLYELVENNREDFVEDIEPLRKELRDVLLPRVVTIYSGRLVLGRSSRAMDPEKIQEFSEALSELLIRQYADGLLEFQSRDQVRVLPLAGDNSDRMTRVRTRVGLESGEEAPVDYVFRKTDEGWKMFDVIVEGISYVATFRNQIGEQIRQQGFDQTLDELKRGDLQVRLEDG